MATTQTPCEKCWKRAGDISPTFAPVVLCFGCQRDLETVMNFLSAKGWQIQMPLTVMLEGPKSSSGENGQGISPPKVAGGRKQGS